MKKKRLSLSIHTVRAMGGDDLTRVIGGASLNCTQRPNSLCAAGCSGSPTCAATCQGC